MERFFDPSTSFRQQPPALGNTYEDDRVLRSYLERVLPEGVRREIEGELAEMGELAGGELYRRQLEDRLLEPRLTAWNAWGERVDTIEVTPLWRRAEELAARRGLVATAYQRRHGSFSRVHQMALAYLFSPSTDVYGCPLAMTDGAARTLELSAAGSGPEREQLEGAFRRLTSRDPSIFWTSGQWMTETTGGSDVGRTETVARRQEGAGGEGSAWRLYGRKWFTSAVSSQMALTLARPEGNPEGAKGLALFYLETRDAEGRPNGLRVARLKDKLGTRKLPTAELLLDGTPAVLLGSTRGGVKAIAPMLNVTRTWNAVTAVSAMARGLALARDYAGKRLAFGTPLAARPLHADTLGGLQAEMEAAFHLTFRVVELLGRGECGEASEGELRLLRLLTPVAKLTTARQAVAVTSEVLEAFGGAGYVEDTGLPMLLRDAQVLPIWEGTTNVLSLDTLRALGADLGGDLGVLQDELEATLEGVAEVSLLAAAGRARAALGHAEAWFREAAAAGPEALEAGARRFSLTLGRALGLGLLCRQAQWSLDHRDDPRPAAAARRFAAQGVDLVVDGVSLEDSSLLG